MCGSDACLHVCGQVCECEYAYACRCLKITRNGFSLNLELPLPLGQPLSVSQVLELKGLPCLPGLCEDAGNLHSGLQMCMASTFIYRAPLPRPLRYLSYRYHCHI